MTRQLFLILFSLSIFFLSCEQEPIAPNEKEEESPVLQVICTTGEASEIDIESARISGEASISNAQEANGTVFFYYSSTISDAGSLVKSGIRVNAGTVDARGGAFFSTVNGLTQSTVYYYIASIIIDGREFNGSVKSFKTKEAPIDNLGKYCGHYTCKSFKAYEWDDGASYYDFDVTISKKDESTNTIWISNIDPILKHNDFADYENRVSATVNTQTNIITVPTWQQLYGVYYFVNPDADSDINIAVQDNGNKLVFRTTWGLYVNDNDPGWIEVYPSGLTLVRESGQGGSIPVNGVSINRQSASLTVGETLTLTANISPSNATNKSVTWSSSSSSIASVSSSGVVTAKASGSATITVTTNDGGYKATCAITVSDGYVPVTGVSLNHTNLEIEVGKEETLVATVSPSNATNKGLVWSSSYDSYVSVDQNGVIKGLKESTVANITVTTVDGNKTATCTVTVTKKQYDKDGLTGTVSNISCRNVKVSGTIPNEVGNIDNSKLTIYFSKNAPTSTQYGDYLSSYDAQIAIKTINSNRSFEGYNDEMDLEPGTKYYYQGNLSGYGINEWGSIKSFTTPALSSMIQTNDITGLSSSEATFNAKLDLTNCVYQSVEYGFMFTPLDGTTWFGRTDLDFDNIDIEIPSTNSVSNGKYFLQHILLPGTRYEYAAYVKFTISNGTTWTYKANTKIVTTPSSPEIIDLGLSVKWRAWNVGASKPEQVGGFYAWGETETKSNYETETYKYYSQGSYTKYNGTDGKTKLDSSDDVASVKLGNNWRMPSISEIRELKNNCTIYEGILLNGVESVCCVSNKNGYTNRMIVIPSAGWISGTERECYYPDQSVNALSSCCIWSSELSSSSSSFVFAMGQHWGNTTTDYFPRVDGQNVRPVKK